MKTATQVGMIGLGKMGAGMAARLEEAGIEVKSFDPFVEAATAKSLEELKDQLQAPRVFWMMLQTGPLEQTLSTLGQIAEPGDILVDGGNSNFHLTQERAAKAAEKQLRYIDVGVSGGVWGHENGYPLMIGGPDAEVAYLEPVFAALAGLAGRVHAGPTGAGHFVKMCHNGVEYGIMAAYAEGFELMASHPDFPGLDLEAIADCWNHGSVVRSWLLELLQKALQEDPDLAKITGWVDDTGEGRWTIEEAVKAAVPAPVMSAALFSRFASRQDNSLNHRILAALRNQFGGHAVHTASGS